MRPHRKKLQYLKNDKIVIVVGAIIEQYFLGLGERYVVHACDFGAMIITLYFYLSTNNRNEIYFLKDQDKNIYFLMCVLQSLW